MTDNLRIWSKVEKTNPAHTKHVNQRGGFTAVSANYQILAATEQFGPIGEGWGYITGDPVVVETDEGLLGGIDTVIATGVDLTLGANVENGTLSGAVGGAPPRIRTFTCRSDGSSRSNSAVVETSRATSTACGRGAGGRRPHRGHGGGCHRDQPLGGLDRGLRSPQPPHSRSTRRTASK